VFRREFKQVCNIEVFLESSTIALHWNKMWRKRFLKFDTRGLIAGGRYLSKVTYRKKALMWLVHMEQMDGMKIKHSRNGRERRLP